MKFHLRTFPLTSIRQIFVKPQRKPEGSAAIYRKKCEEKAKRVTLTAMPPVSQVSKDFRKKFLKCLYTEKNWWRTLPERTDYSRVIKQLSLSKGPDAPPLSWRLIK